MARNSVFASLSRGESDIPPPRRLSADLNVQRPFDLENLLRSSCASLRTGDTDHDRGPDRPLSSIHTHKEDLCCPPAREERYRTPATRRVGPGPAALCRLARLRWPAPPSGCIGSSAEPSAIGVVWPHCPGSLVLQLLATRPIPPARAGRPSRPPDSSPSTRLQRRSSVQLRWVRGEFSHWLVTVSTAPQAAKMVAGGWR